jgi:hypothetical protein
MTQFKEGYRQPENWDEHLTSKSIFRREMAKGWLG